MPSFAFSNLSTKFVVNIKSIPMKTHFLLLAALFWVVTHSSCRDQSPSSSAAAVIPTDTLEKYEIPVKYLGGHLYLPTSINDSVKGNFLFDTGADGLCIDTLFLFRSPLSVRKFYHAYVGGVGTGAQKVKQILDPYTCRAGHITLKPDFTVTLQLKPLLGRYADGILGINFAKDSALYIDYEKEKIKITRFDTTVAQGYEKLPLLCRGNRVYTEAQVDIQGHKIKGLFLLDLGAGSSILTSQCARQNKLEERLHFQIKSYTNQGGIGGESSSCSFRADTFRLGNFKLTAPILRYSHDKKGALSYRDYIGLLGNDILEQFDVILDFPDSSLYLRPNKKYNRKQTFSSTGFAYVDRTDICEGWIIRALYENLPAEKAGLKIGDIILAINGIQVKNIPFEEQERFWENLDTPYLLTVQRNDQRRSVKMELKIDPVEFSE